MSIVKDSLQIELKNAIGISKGYINKIKTAKTKPKTDFYTKKLKKNNKIVAELIIGLDKLEKTDYNTQNKI